MEAEKTAPPVRSLREVSLKFAAKLVGGLLAAASTPTWMPGTTPGAMGSLPRRSASDEG